MPGPERETDRQLKAPAEPALRVAGLFAGIGGIELGLHSAGHRAVLLCEIDDSAARVLAHHADALGDPEIHPDITTLEALPDVDLVAAGFPCQDLSQAGQTRGIGGAQSGLVDHVFRLLDQQDRSPRWVLLENVPFMLQLDRGQAMDFLVESLEALGFDWAYRIVDTRAFGLPQRRKRVLLLASRTEDPKSVLFADDVGVGPEEGPGDAFGFYWTEGLRGLGWARDATPTLKGGSTIGIPSPPAIWLPEEDALVVPDIRDAERLQGFPAGWTAAACHGRRSIGRRWKLVGNAVSVPVARWIGERIALPVQPIERVGDQALERGRAWPHAAWGGAGSRHHADVSPWPVTTTPTHLRDFLEFPTRPLSYRASRGFFKRANQGQLRMDPSFLEAVGRHVERMADAAPSLA